MAHKYTPDQRAFFESNIFGCSYREIQALFNKEFGVMLTLDQIKSYVGNNKLTTGRTGRFQAGHVPVNKGQKGISYPGTEDTQFKKGSRPWNYKPVGAERINCDGYIDVKIADPAKWKAKHVLLWEAENGPVPKGHALLFADGNKLNVSLNNLILVSRAQLVRLNQNGLIQNDADLTRSGVLVADLMNKIGSMKKDMCNTDLYTGNQNMR